MNVLEAESDSLQMSDNEQLKEIVAKIDELKLSVGSVEKKEAAERVFFGSVEALIDELGVVTVRPQPSESLLDFGTAVFIRQKIPGFEKEEENYTLLGHVEDIFGAVRSPMYAVKMLSSECNSVPLGEKVYYINNAETKLFTVKSLTK